MNRKHTDNDKQRKARPFEKLLVLLLTGKPVTKEEIVDVLGWGAERGSGVKGPKIYNISSYIWDIKNIPQVDGQSLVIKSIREGKKVVSYQLMSVDLAKKYLIKRKLYTEKKETKKTDQREEKQTVAEKC